MNAQRRRAKSRALKIDKRRWRGKYGLRLKVLRRDDYVCQLQLGGCTVVATTVHISPVLGGNHDLVMRTSA